MASARAFRPEHSGLRRPGAKKPLRLTDELPHWHGWRWTDEHKRALRWIESTLVLPVGVGQGEAFKVAVFQRDLLRRIYDSLATFISIPAGNGKTSLMMAVALERITRGDDYVEIDVLATKETQAQRLVEGCVRMIECNPMLLPLFDVYRNNSMLEYRPTGSTLRAHPQGSRRSRGSTSTWRSSTRSGKSRRSWSPPCSPVSARDPSSG